MDGCCGVKIFRFYWRFIEGDEVLKEFSIMLTGRYYSEDEYRLREKNNT